MKCKTGKAVGLNGITNDLWKEIIIYFKSIVNMDIHVMCLELGHIPPDRRTVVVTKLYTRKGHLGL
jgi:hypothetical protein